MRLFSRAETAPAAVIEVAGIRRGEKVLAFAQDGERWLLGTRLAVYVIVPGEPTHRMTWETVQAVDWVQDDSTLTVAEVGQYGQARASYVFTLDNPVLLLQLIRERVTSSVVLQRGYLIDGKKGFKVIGRRSPAGGPISWMHEFDAGIDPGRSDVQEAAEAALVQARADVGE